MTEAKRLADKRIVNPYNAHGPSNPRYFADREELLLAFMQNVAAVAGSKGVTRPINIAITGGWGMGKTSTLLKFRDLLKEEAGEARTFSACVSLKPTCCTDSETFFVTMMESIFREYQSTVGLPQKALDFIREELNLIDHWKISKVSLHPEFERKDAPPIKGIHFVETMMKFWEKLRSGGVELAVVMLDDIHYTLLHGNGDLLLDLRTDMQALSSSGAQFMFIITGPASLYPEMRDKAEPFTRLFERFELKPFDIRGIKLLIEKPLRAEGVDLVIDADVVEKIHNITGGHPYFVTLAMQDVLNSVKAGRLDLAALDEIVPRLVEHFARVKFNDDIGRASEAEQQVLRQMAAMGGDGVSPSALDGTGKRMLLERLVNKGLVVKVKRGKYQLYNPLFKEYLKKGKDG